MTYIRKVVILSVVVITISFALIHFQNSTTGTSSYYKKGLNHSIFSTVVPISMSFVQKLLSPSVRILSANKCTISTSANQAEPEWKNAKTVFDFTVKDIDNQDVKLDKYKGKVMLIVNVASKCGFTKGNYKELNELYSKYKDQGLAILGFPCNQFGHQEPGCDVDIKEFVKKNNVEWDIFAKIDVNGDDAIPLYHWLKSKERGTFFDAIKWNFTKFLINKQGEPVARYAPNKSPLEFEDEIKAELEK